MFDYQSKDICTKTVNSLLTDKTTSFLRRAAQFHLGNLEDYEVEEAFNLTVQEGANLSTLMAMKLPSRKLKVSLS